MPPQQPKRGNPDPLGDLLDEKSLADEISKAIEGNECPPERDLLAFVRKELKEAERLEVKSHLSFCGRCQKKVHGFFGESLGLPKGAVRNPSKSFRAKRLPGISLGGRKLSNRTLAIAGGALFLLLCFAIIWARSGGDFPYAIKVAHAASDPPVRVGQALSVHLSTPRAIHLIEITIDGDGRVQSRIAPGPRQGKFSKGDPLVVTPRAAGEFDLYVVPCPSGESPETLHAGVQQFLKTDTALSRENQRSSIETVLSLYKARFLHQVLRVHS